MKPKLVMWRDPVDGETIHLGSLQNRGHIVHWCSTHEDGIAEMFDVSTSSGDMLSLDGHPRECTVMLAIGDIVIGPA